MKAKIQRWLFLFAIRNLRKLIDAADDWTHAQEVALRGQSPTAAVEKAATLEAVDQNASAQREKVILRDRRNQARKTNPSRQRADRPRRARLVYQAGAFVRMEQ